MALNPLIQALLDPYGGATPPVVPSATPEYRKGGVVIQRGTAPASVYLPSRPRVGVPSPTAGDDPYAGYLQPFAPAGGREYDLGSLDQAAADWGRGLHPPDVLADMAKYRLGTRQLTAEGDFQQGQLRNDAERNQVERQKNDILARQTDYTIAQGEEAKTPQAVAAKGQADVLAKLYGMAPGAAGPDGQLPPTEKYLQALDRHRQGLGLGPVQPGTDEYAALMASKYGPELEERLAGKPYGLLETPFLGNLIPEGGYRFEAMRDLARRNIGLRPGTRVRVRAKAGPVASPSPGVSRYLHGGRDELFPQGY